MIFDGLLLREGVPVIIQRYPLSTQAKKRVHGKMMCVTSSGFSAWKRDPRYPATRTGLNRMFTPPQSHRDVQHQVGVLVDGRRSAS
jgi:hypothetical protein